MSRTVQEFSEFQEACFVSRFIFELLISPALTLTLSKMHYIGLFDTVVLMTNDVSVILYLKNIINQMS